MGAKPVVVQKFGGTSVGKLPTEIARDIVSKYSENYRVIVVCSARSTNIKAEGTTTCLLRACEQALSRAGNFRKEIDNIRRGHHKAVLDILGEEDDELKAAIDHECDQAIKILEASKILDEISNKTMDLVLSVGEKLACLFMTAVIKHNGQDATYVDLSKVWVNHSNHTHLDNEFYDELKSAIADKINQVPLDSVPVVTGFFGMLPNGLINTVGRGYTDLCAALAAVGLGATELQIWKEVDGIFSADPRKVPTARLLDQITPEEAAELTYYGSEVIHPFTMEQVIRARIPIRIKNVMNPQGNGTIIYPSDRSRTGVETPVHPPLAVTKSFLNLSQAKRGATAVTSKSKIVVLNIHSNKTKRSHGFLAQVFTILDRWRLIVDLISTSEVHISMAIHAENPDGSLLSAVNDLRKYGTVDVTSNLCIVSLVGNNMKQHVGIAGQMFTTLAEAGINLEMISQGASEINISCVINEGDALKALNVLHHRLLGLQ